MGPSTAFPKKGRPVHRIAAAVLCASVLGVSALGASASAAPCLSPSDAEAVDVRLLQTELMVAALTCRQHAAYNSFVERFRPELVGHARTLKAAFARQYGPASETHLNGFVTRIANETALRSATTDGYCGQSVAIFDGVLDLKPGQLSSFASAQSFSGSHGLPACTATRASKHRLAQSGQGTGEEPGGAIR